VRSNVSLIKLAKLQIIRVLDLLMH